MIVIPISLSFHIDKTANTIFTSHKKLIITVCRQLIDCQPLQNRNQAFGKRHYHLAKVPILRLQSLRNSFTGFRKNVVLLHGFKKNVDVPLLDKLQ